MPTDAQEPVASLDVFLTAEEAFPAFEKLVLGAEHTIHAGFRIFDLTTSLRSPEGRAIGETWFDLFEHTLARGVDITLVVSDFDPIVGTKYHRKSWETARQLAAVDAVTDRGTLTFRIARHPARAGLIPRLLLKNRVREKFREQSPDRNTPGLNALDKDDLFEISPVTHHQKLAVFDRETLYIGGLDLDERRYDTKEHAQPPNQTWQDVQVAVTGPVVQAALAHLESFEDVVSGHQAPAPKADGLVRTLSARRWPAPFHLSPKILVNEIEEAHLAAVSRARHLIYFETQFFRHLPLADAVAKAGRENGDLRAMIVLPAAPEDVAFEGNNGRDARLGEHLQAEAVSRMTEGFGDRILFCSPAQHRQVSDTTDRDTLENSPIVYVHSKVSVFDDTEAIVSSANLNGRSLKWDTEAGVHLTRSDHVFRLRERLIGHWFPHLKKEFPSHPANMFAACRETVLEDVRRRPENRVSRLLPYDLDAAVEAGEPVHYVPNELV
ncbi:MAG: phospholipase D family protein [Paracoccaceae bacterium]